MSIETRVPLQLSLRGETNAIPRLSLPELSDDTLRRLVSDMDGRGFGVVENYLMPEDLAGIAAFVETAVAAAGGQYVGFVGKRSVSGTTLDVLSDPGAFATLLRRIYEMGTGKPAPKQSLYQLLRCLKGETGMRHSLIFHYDSYVVTALLPIIIPASGQAGHLLMRPNWRGLRGNYMWNLLDKLLLDNRLTQGVLRYLHRHGRLGFTQVAMVPGNLYLFWGYRAVHANEPCDPDQIRATALFHFADPHLDSTIRRFTGKAPVRSTKGD